MRRVKLDAPFVGGMITDLPDYAIGPNNSSFAQDGYSPQGVFKQRGGWEYDGTTADVAGNLHAVYRAKFALADVTRTVTSVTSSGVLYIHNPASSGTLIYNTSGTKPIPRCMYHDELIFCYQDGLTPLRRYSGAGTDTITHTGTFSTTANRATFTGGTYGSIPDEGAFIGALVSGLGSHRLVATTSTSSVTLEDIIFSGVINGAGFSATATGHTCNCVSVYSAGTASANSTTVTGYGTLWDTANVANNDGILFIPSTGSASLGHITSNASSETSLSGSFPTVSTETQYHILRACPFKDAAAHKESLWGTGVAQFPNRVYVSPPGWNPTFHPGLTLPYRTDGSKIESENANDFLLDFIDVPSPYDGDHNVAILPSPGPLLVLKRRAVYGIYGAYGGLSVDMIADGIGCIDIRSAQSFDEGQFWAGEGGIYWYVGGQVVDLTAGKINREWRALTRDFDYGTSDYCSIGLTQGHLVVHITTDGGGTQRTYLCDLRDQTWQSRLSNVASRYFFTSRIAGEAERLYWVSDARQGRVMNLAPAFNGEGTAADDAGSAPRLQAYTTAGLGRADGIEGLTRLVDLDVHANIYDAGAAGSTQLDVSVVSGGGIGNPDNSTKTLDSINSDTTDRIDRHSRRVARDGRLHQVRFAVDPLGTDTAATKVEIHQIIGTFRDSRSRA